MGSQSELMSACLEESFDANKLTKPQLRSLLAEFGVSNVPPMTAKKEVLVDAFNESVFARRVELANAKKRVKPSAEGITFLDDDSKPSPKKGGVSLSAATGDSDDEEPKARKGRSVGRARGGPAAATQAELDPPSSSPSKRDSSRKGGARSASPRRTGGRRPTAKTPAANDKGPNTSSDALDTNEDLPVAKKSAAEAPPQQQQRRRSISRSPSVSKRSVGSTEELSSYAPRTPEKQSGAPTIVGKNAASAAPLESPLVALQRSLPGYSDTPNTAMVKLHSRLTRIAAINRQPSSSSSLPAAQSANAAFSSSPFKQGSATARPSSKASAKSMLHFLATMAQTTLFVVLVCAINVYFRWKYIYPFPYCSQKVVKPFLPARWNLDEALANMREYCLPCPSGATCKGGRLLCPDGYLEKSSLLYLGSTCQPDRHKLNILDDLNLNIQSILSERAGNAICNGSTDPDQRRMSEAELRTALKAIPGALWNGPKFDSYFGMAMKQISTDSQSHIYLSETPEKSLMLESTAPAIPLGCRIRNYLVDLLYQARYALAGIGALLASVMYIWYRITSGQKLQRTIDDLVHGVLQILAEQDALNRRDPTCPSTISIHQLRDALFLKANAKEKSRLWPKVCQAITRNSNVRESVMVIKGEQHRVWEWIGSDLLSPHKGISARHFVGREFQSSPSIANKASNDGKSGSTTSLASAPGASTSLYPRLRL